MTFVRSLAIALLLVAAPLRAEQILEALVEAGQAEQAAQAGRAGRAELSQVAGERGCGARLHDQAGPAL